MLALDLRSIFFTSNPFRWWILLFFLLACGFSAFAQQKDSVKVVVVDTVKVDKHSYIITGDSIIFTQKDTVMYVTDTITNTLENVLKERDSTREDGFYQKIKEKLGKRKITKKLFDLVFDLSPAERPEQKQAVDSLAHIPEQYDGKIVGNIRLYKVDVLGGSVTDTTAQTDIKLARFVNDIHVNTRNSVIRNNLLLEKGDEINQYKILDNERILRRLPFIRDARVRIQPRADGSDTVDLLVLTQDILSISGSVEPRGLSRANVHVDDNNIFGTSHSLQNEVVIEPNLDQYLGYRGSYRLPNIRGSFIEANLDYQNTNYENIYRFQLNRSFIVPSIKYAGGIEFSYNKRTTYAPWIDYDVLDTLSSSDLLELIPYSYWYQDYWLARSFIPSSMVGNNRSRFTVALRYSQTQFDIRPTVRADTNVAYHNYRLMLGKIGFSKRYYSTEQLVYTYGRTEDIPIGYLLEFTLGPQFGEFYNRLYNGLSYSSGRFLDRWGYMAVLSELGGFWREGNLEEGLFQVGIESFSYLIHKRRTKFRFFTNLNYTTGINRPQTINFQNAYINIRNENGIRGLSSEDMTGNERLTFNLESVAYTPYNFYGFRFALFAFADIGWISRAGEPVFSSKTYQGYGFGARIRNENLAFKTFQVRLSFYPIVPNGEQFIGFTISNISLGNFLDFNSKKPDIFQFY